MVSGNSSLMIGSTSSYASMGPAANPRTSRLVNVLRTLSRCRDRLGTEMDEIIPNLYLGSLRDALDVVQLKKNRIQYIVSVHDLSASHPVHDHMKVLRIRLSDCSSVDISAHFPTTNEFIHSARLKQTAVLVHCLAGVSRSATIVAAYLITVCDLSFWNALTFISRKRPVVNPNFGFRMQLCTFAERISTSERKRLRERFGAVAFDIQFAKDRTAVSSKNELHSINSPLTNTSTSAPSSIANLTPVHTACCCADNVACGRTDSDSSRDGEGSIPANLREPPIRKVIAKALPLPEIHRVQMSTLAHNPLVKEIGYMDE